MTIKSKEGYYVKGTVSELMLDQVKEGTILNCSSQNGDFEAEVIDVSEYPVSGDNYSGNGNQMYLIIHILQRFRTKPSKYRTKTG